MKPFHGLLFCVFLFLAGSPDAVAQPDTAGIIKVVSGDVFLTSAQNTVKAKTNMPIHQGDSIQTGAKSGAGLIFEDDTVVALGPNSQLAVVSFLFDPANLKLSFIARLIHGTFSFITGQIAKLAPTKVVLETPDATLGVRGTKFVVKVD